MDSLTASLKVAGSGMRAQSLRMRILSENIANANSTAATPEQDPYRRKLVTFKDYFDPQTGANLVNVSKVSRDTNPFTLKYEPGHPAANQNGYVKYPNVNTLIEFSDVREAQLSYQANINVMRTSRQMMSGIIDLLR